MADTAAALCAKASESMSLSNELGAQDPQPDDAPVEETTEHAEITQSSQRSMDLKTVGSENDIPLPTSEKESEREEDDIGAKTPSEEKETMLEHLKEIQSRIYAAGGRFDHKMLVAQESRTSLSERTQQAPHLSFALQAYVRLMDDRVAALEEQNRMRRSEQIADKDLPETKTKESDKPSSIAKIARVAWPEFRRKKKVQVEAEQYAIDVLIGDAAISFDPWRDRSGRRIAENGFQAMQYINPHEAWDFNVEVTTQAQNEFVPSTTGRSIDTTQGSYPPVPERIRINGEALKQLLEKFLDVDLASPLESPVVLLRPFKLLVHYRDQILKLSEQLKRKFENTESGAQGADAVEGNSSNLLAEYGTDQAYRELQCLIEFMEDDLRIFKLFEDGALDKIAFSELWHIFRPGTEVVTSKRPICAYRVLHATGGRPYLSPPESSREVLLTGELNSSRAYKIPHKSSDFVISCYQIGFDGKRFGPAVHSFSIQSFSDLMNITALPIYPLRFDNDQSNVREMLLRNSETFLDVCACKHVIYRGLNLHEVEEIDSEIIVDFHGALWDHQDKDKSNWGYSVQFGIQRPESADKAEVIMTSPNCITPDCCGNDRIFNDLIVDHQRTEDFLADRDWLTMDDRYFSDDPNSIPKEDLILLPNRLFAFVLKDRKWAVVDINGIKRVPPPTRDTWESLILPRGHKDMVYSLVQSHFRDRQQSRGDSEVQADLVRGKGKGLIILLHGAPGVGKTSTAECVADLCSLPLYPITCGDLGITAVDVETRLRRIFMQAQRWNSVLLLDEADVFLSARGTDVQHNSLVSVFLRVLEYYQGILFLTTNRVGRMDEAFRSRVHISLYYPPLDLHSTVEIFETNLARTIERKRETLKVRGDEIMRFAEKHFERNEERVRWNGRQIRNAFHIAVALAENEMVERAAMQTRNTDESVPRKATLRARHLRVVEEASTKFDEYLTSVLGMAQATRLKNESVRHDAWQPKGRRPKDQQGNRTRRPYESDSSETETGSEDDENAPLPQTKGARKRDDAFYGQSESTRRPKGRSANPSDESADEPTARERGKVTGKTKPLEDRNEDSMEVERRKVSVDKTDYRSRK